MRNPNPDCSGKGGGGGGEWKGGGGGVERYAASFHWNRAIDKFILYFNINMCC